MNDPILIFFRFAMASIILLGCNTVQDDVSSLDEYDVPFEPEIEKKIYTYLRKPGYDTIRHVYSYGNPKAWEYIQTVYVNDEIASERHYLVVNKRKKLLHDYYYADFQKIEGDIKVREEIDVGHRFKGLHNKITFTDADGFRTTFTEKDLLIRDTALYLNEKNISGLRIDYLYTVNESTKYIPFISHTDEYKITACFLQNVGFYQQSFAMDDTTQIDMKLISVKKVKRGSPSM